MEILIIIAVAILLSGMLVVYHLTEREIEKSDKIITELKSEIETLEKLVNHWSGKYRTRV